MIRIAVFLGVIVTSAWADDTERLDVDPTGGSAPRPAGEAVGVPTPRLAALEVGETIERDVGFAMGLLCDDLTIIHADLRANTPESNTFTVTGVAEGTTMCRVGTAPDRPAYLFEIHVVASRHPR